MISIAYLSILIKIPSVNEVLSSASVGMDPLLPLTDVHKKSPDAFLCTRPKSATLARRNFPDHIIRNLTGPLSRENYQI